MIAKRLERLSQPLHHSKRHMFGVVFAFFVVAFMFAYMAGSPKASATSIQQTITITDIEQVIDLGKTASSTRDGLDRQLSEVIDHRDWQQQWSSVPLAEGEKLWVRAQVRNSLPSKETFYLSIAEHSLDTVDVYILDDMQRITHSYLTGADRDYNLRTIKHRHFILPFILESGDEVSIYLRIGDDGPLLMPIKIWHAERWIAVEQDKQVIFGIFVGALMVFTLYFLVTYSLLRSPVRFWFSLACFVMMLGVLNIHGFISQFTGVTKYSPIVTAILLATLMLMMAKVSRSLFVNSPRALRYFAYAMPLLMMASPFVLDAQTSNTINMGLIGICVFAQCAMAIHYRNRFSSRPSHIFVIGWLSILLAACCNFYFYSNGNSLDTAVTVLIIFLSVVGILAIGVAIEAHEKVIMRFEQSEQEKRIDGLKQFYQLFRNSAEGLYTSTPDGTLISVNPAMWQLFGYDSEDDMLSAVQSTDEFYADGSDRDVLIGELRSQQTVLGREFRGLRKDGSEFWFSLSCQLHEEGEETFLYGSIFDVTERKQSNISLEYLATHDSLTGVYNRREFERQLQQNLSHDYSVDKPLTLLYMDLDQFKVVNDTCGHKAGDALLQQLAHLLDEAVGEKGLLSRLGGDEFGVLMSNTNGDEAYVLASKLLNVVSDFRFMWENKVFSLGISIGLVERSDNTDAPEHMMSMADAACYIAKEQGRNQIHRYSSQDVSTKRYENELNWLAHINEALEQDNFRLYYQHYQPLHTVAEGHRYEILVRMQTEEQGLVPPGAFLPAAERYSLGAKIDRWVIHHYFDWLNSNPSHCSQLEKCNINLCGQSLADRDFKLFVLNAFEKFGVPYAKICFEITEGMAIIKMEETLEFIKTFRQLGCTFALDDFGSGFSSYGYLKQLPVQYVKIDGAFVRDLLSDPIDLAMVRSINDVAKAIGMETVAEFVENSDIKVQLGKMGVDYAQGYGIAVPEPLSSYKAFGE